jgi:predicted RNA-binding Zn-ribbon protein involved in translation (DUF1610 family)
MGLVDWFKHLWEDVEEEYYCPKCGSTQFGTFSIMSNFAQVISGQEDPKYIQTYKCCECGFKTTDWNDLGKRKIEKTRV